MSKLSYLSRVTPHHIFLPFAKNIIDGVRECVCTILGHPLSNSHWGQCLLKPRHGELGIINQESLAKGAYLASLLACVPSIESVSTQQQLNLHVLQFDHLDHPGEPNALESVISELCEHITDTHIWYDISLIHYTTKYDWVLVKWVLDKIPSADSNIPGHTTTEDRQNRIQAISSGAAIPLQSVVDITGEPTKLQALFSDLASKVAMKILLSSLDPEHIIRIHSESDEGAACIQTQPLPLINAFPL